MPTLPRTLALCAAAPLALAAVAARAEDAPGFTLTPKLAVYSEYEYRGIAQTSEDPALQFNLDFAHKSGFYLGTFLSNIKWLKDTAGANGFSTDANLEWDIYALILGHREWVGLRQEFPVLVSVGNVRTRRHQRLNDPTVAAGDFIGGGGNGSEEPDLCHYRVADWTDGPGDHGSRIAHHRDLSVQAGGFLHHDSSSWGSGALCDY